MKKVFLVESDPLQLAAWETRLKDSSWTLYSLKNMDDFDFRFSDFDPDVLVLGQTFGSGVAFEQATEKTTQIPVYVLAFSSDEVHPSSKLLEKPIDLGSLPDILEGLLN